MSSLLRLKAGRICSEPPEVQILGCLSLVHGHMKPQSYSSHPMWWVGCFLGPLDNQKELFGGCLIKIPQIML